MVVYKPILKNIKEYKMSFKYDKDTLKENLTIEEVFDLVSELGGEPIMGNGLFTARTICHGGDNHKL